MTAEGCNGDGKGLGAWRPRGGGGRGGGRGGG